MTAADFLEFAARISLIILSLALLLVVVRIVRGPSLPDRVLALDTLVAVAIGFIATIGIATGYPLYVDIAIALGLVGFLSTVAFARFILTRGRAGEETGEGRSRAPEAKSEIEP